MKIFDIFSEGETQIIQARCEEMGMEKERMIRHTYIRFHFSRHSTHPSPVLAIPTTDKTVGQCPLMAVMWMMHFAVHKGDYVWVA